MAEDFGFRVLIVDDEPDATATLAKFLTSRGYGTATAANGHEALDLVQSDRFQAVMTDLRMPGMDGADFLARVRFEKPDLPIIVMTGHTSFEADDAVWTNAGVMAVLHKPLNIRKVLEILSGIAA